MNAHTKKRKGEIPWIIHVPLYMAHMWTFPIPAACWSICLPFSCKAIHHVSDAILILMWDTRAKNTISTTLAPFPPAFTDLHNIGKTFLLLTISFKQYPFFLPSKTAFCYATLVYNEIFVVIVRSSVNGVWLAILWQCSKFITFEYHWQWRIWLNTSPENHTKEHAAYIQLQ